MTTNHSDVPANPSRKVLYATLAFPPAGIFLGWRNGAWSRNAKIGWTVVALIVFVAWGGVVGLLRGSQDASIWEVLNGSAVAAVAYGIFAVWTNAESSLIRKAMYSIGLVLALGGVGGLTQGLGKQEGTQATGTTFSKRKMDELFKKVVTLRLGMTIEDVCQIMGPPTKRDFIDPSDLPVVPGLPVIDARPLDTLGWSSTEDPGEVFILVFFRSGEAYAIKAEDRGKSVFSLEDL